MDCAIAVINLLAQTQIDHSKIVGKCVRIFLKPQMKSQDVVEALLKSSICSQSFLIFANNGVFALKP